MQPSPFREQGRVRLTIFAERAGGFSLTEQDAVSG